GRSRSSTAGGRTETGNGEGGIRTLEAGISPPNALAGRRLQPLGHFSGRAHPTAGHGPLPRRAGARARRYPSPATGGVAERSNAAVSKTVIRLNGGSRVQIPPPPLPAGTRATRVPA